METEVNIQEVLKNMRESVANLVQENAILKAQITALENHNVTVA
jgi:hypothetical protein